MKYTDSGSDVYGQNWTKSLHGMINVMERTLNVKYDKQQDVMEWFFEHLKLIENPRLKTLFKTLQPVRWDWSSSIGSRKATSLAAHQKVNLILPFLNETERKLAEQWKKENNNKLLWE